MEKLENANILSWRDMEKEWLTPSGYKNSLTICIVFSQTFVLY